MRFNMMMTGLATMMAAGALATPAMADNNNGYGVSTAARAREVYCFDGFVSAYRTSGDSSGNYTRPGDAPSVQVIGCQNYNPAVQCSGSASGTGGSDYNLTASTSFASRSDDAGGPPYPVSTGTGSARADLATGELGAFAVSDVWRDYRLAPTYNGGEALAGLTDTLMFDIAGAGAGTITNISVSFVLDGLTSAFDPRGAAASVQEQLYFGTAAAIYTFGDYANDGFDFLSNTDRGWVSSSWDLATPGQVRFTGVYALSGASDIVGIANQLLVSAGGGASSLFGSTSHLSLILPTNVTYSSASGVFLSGAGSAGAVPEPASWAMLVLGFGLVGRTMRRRRTTPDIIAV